MIQCLAQGVGTVKLDHGFLYELFVTAAISTMCSIYLCIGVFVGWLVTVRPFNMLLVHQLWTDEAAQPMETEWKKCHAHAIHERGSICMA